MAVDSRFRDQATNWLAVGILVIATGTGTYLVGDEAPQDLEFVHVGWWNIRDFSDASRDDDEMAAIARCLDGVDVLAIGELNDDGAIERLAIELGPEWKWAATDKIGRTSGSREKYGFIWNSDVVEMVGTISIDPDPGDKIDRDPAWATFQTTNAHLDFTLMGVHITWGSLVANRKAENRTMAEVWNRTIQTLAGDRDLILMGDFNRNVGDDSFDPLLNIGQMIRCNEDTGPTVISGTSTYDQMFLDLDHTNEWTGEFETFAFDQTHFQGDTAPAKLAVSDHRPVWLSLVIPSADDD